ncbi:MAG: hypothetical protein ACRCTE_10710, partial [Cellulosilyticaceae bacterium]
MKKVGIRQKLILTFLLVSIVPIIIIGGLSVTRAIETIQDEVSFYSDKVVTLLGKNVDLITQEIEKEFVSLISDAKVSTALREQARGTGDYEGQQIVKNELQRITGSNIYVPAAMVVSPHESTIAGTFVGETNFTWKALEEAGIIAKVKESKGTYWLRGYKLESELLVFKEIINPLDGTSMGIAVFKVMSVNFQKQIDSLQLEDQEAHIYLLDEENKLLLSDHEELIGKSIKEVSPKLFDEEEAFE